MYDLPMKTAVFTRRGVGFLLAFSLASPQSAWALRPKGAESHEVTAGLEERLLGAPAAVPAAGGSDPLTTGLEERYVLRFDPASGRLESILEEGPRWTPLAPASPTGLISPNDEDWALSLEEAKLRALAVFLFEQGREFSRGYSLQTGDTAVVDKVETVHPIPGLEPYRGVLGPDLFQALLAWLNVHLFLPAGAVIEFAGAGLLASYAVLEKPWEQVPVLGGRASIWKTRKSTVRREGSDKTAYVAGLSVKNLAVHDPEEARDSTESKYQHLLERAGRMGIPDGAVRRVQALYEADPERFLNLLGSDYALREELKHAEDFVWAAHFFAEAMRATKLDLVFIAESVVKPGSPLEQSVWMPAKSSPSGSAGLLSAARDLTELSGQTRAVAEFLEELNRERGPEWAKAFFWLYVYEKKQELTRQAADTTPGHSFEAAQRVLSFLEGKGLSAGITGERAAELMREFHDKNFLTEKERIALLEKAEGGGRVSLGLRQPDAGLEEGAAPGDEVSSREAFSVAVLGAPAFRAVPGLKRAMEAVRQAGMEEHFIVLPEEMPAGGLEELADFLMPALARGAESFTLYGKGRGPVTRSFSRLLEAAQVSHRAGGLEELARFVQKVLANLEDPAALRTTVGDLLAASGLEEAA